MSDSYDPEFSTSANAHEVRDAIMQCAAIIGGPLGGLKNVVGVVQGPPGRTITHALTEREWRVIRFALNRAAESI
jgi:hypothetical protein